MAKKIINSTTKKTAVKKNAGVGRKKVTDTTTDVCKFGKGRAMCKTPLTSKTDLSSGYCGEHRKVVKQQATDKVKADRAAKKATVKKAATKSKGNPNIGNHKRISVMDMSCTAFIRSCAKLGLTIAESQKAVKKHSARGASEPSIHTFRTQYSHVRAGRMTAPSLTRDQQNAIKVFKK